MKRALALAPALAAAAFALTACATASAAPPGPTAGIGEVAVAGSLRIGPIAVIEDSRCPANVQCVWAGRLVILAEVEFKGSSKTLSVNLALGETLRNHSESVTLIEAVPDKVVGGSIEPGDYRFTFRASAN